MDDTQLSEALECLLFVSGEAVPVERLAEALEVDAERVLQALEAMRARSDGGLQVAAVCRR